MNFAKKLRDAVASNFIEIARTDEPPSPHPAPFQPAFGAESEAESYRVPAVPAVSEAEEAPVVEPAAEMAAEPVTVAEAHPAEAEAPAAPETREEPARRDRLRFVSETGSVDVEALLKSAGLPPVPFPAEKAGQMIAALPSDLPMKMKRMTVKATLEALDRNIDAQEIVSDAVLKKVHIGQFRDDLNEEVVTTAKEAERDIARLEAEVARLKALVSENERKRAAADAVCRAKLDMIEQVIFFFQPEEQAVVEPTPDPEEELPAFMRDDSVKRMLGINPGEESLPNLEAAERRPRSRRRIPVSEGATEATAEA